MKLRKCKPVHTHAVAEWLRLNCHLLVQDTLLHWPKDYAAKVIRDTLRAEGVNTIGGVRLSRTQVRQALTLFRRPPLAERDAAAAPQGVPIPDHLRGRNISLWPDDECNVVHIREPGGTAINFAGIVDDWWSVLTTEQRRAIIMASVVTINQQGGKVDVGEVRVFDSGEMSFEITTTQRQEYFDLHPKA